MAITIDLPPQMAEEALGCATASGITVEKMLVDCLAMELNRRRSANDVRDYLMCQSDWLPEGFEFDREEANCR